MEETQSNNPPSSEQTTPVGTVSESTGTASETNVATSTEQTQETQDTFFDPKTVPPELEQAYKQMQAAFTKKTQEISDVRKKSEYYDQLVNYRPFVDWYQKHQSGEDRIEKPSKEESDSKQPEQKEFNLSDEDFELMKSDKNKFFDTVKTLATQIAQQTVLPIAKEARQKVELLENTNKIDNFAKDHPDFWDLHDKGLILKTIERYPNLEIDDIYRLAKYPFLEQEAINKAHQIVQNKKNSVVEKPGTGAPAATVKKFKNRYEAMLATFDAVSAGQSVPEIQIGE